MRICAWPNGSGSRFWRLEDPFKHLQRKGIDAYVSDNGINEKEVEEADILVLQSCTDKQGIAYLYQMQQERGKKIVVECDDYFDVNDDSPFKIEHEKWDAKFVITRTMQMADLITTTTDHLADKLREFNKSVAVLPNYLDMERWSLPAIPNDTGKIRIGWAGSITHLEDMKLVVKSLKQICKEFKNIQLVIIGDPRVGALFEGLPVETMNGVPFEAWPSKLHSLRLDIGLAPLRDTEFNRCKSNIKWLEYSIAKIPGVFSPTVYEQSANHLIFDGVLGMTAENDFQWYQNIKNYIVCKELRDEVSSRAYSVVAGGSRGGYSLEKHINKWVEVYSSLTQTASQSIKTK